MPRGELESLLDAWQKRTFSPAERVALRASLEGKGIAISLIDKFFESGESDRENWYAKQPQRELKKNVILSSPSNSLKQKKLPEEKPRVDNSIFSINDIVLGEAYE